MALNNFRGNSFSLSAAALLYEHSLHLLVAICLRQILPCSILRQLCDDVSLLTNRAAAGWRSSNQYDLTFRQHCNPVLCLACVPLSIHTRYTCLSNFACIALQVQHCLADVRLYCASIPLLCLSFMAGMVVVHGHHDMFHACTLL